MSIKLVIIAVFLCFGLAYGTISPTIGLCNWECEQIPCRTSCSPVCVVNCSATCTNTSVEDPCLPVATNYTCAHSNDTLECPDCQPLASELLCVPSAGNCTTDCDIACEWQCHMIADMCLTPKCKWNCESVACINTHSNEGEMKFYSFGLGFLVMMVLSM